MKEKLGIILSNKSIFSGISILMVLLYHQPKCSAISGVWFYPGFLGVDVFLFFSGFGLCYSFNKNGIYTFYKRRFVRIAPLYILLGLLAGLKYYEKFTWFDYLCNITSLSYWGMGGFLFDWYLSALIVLYLLFPLLYKIIDSFKPQNAVWGG